MRELNFQEIPFVAGGVVPSRVTPPASPNIPVGPPVRGRLHWPLPDPMPTPAPDLSES